MPSSSITKTAVMPTTRYVQRIQIQLNKTLQGFIEIGKILAEAEEKLGRKSWLDMVNYDLPFSRRTAEKLVKIAEDKRITNPAYMQALPPHWTSLHELTFLDDDQFDDAIKNGSIHPDVERKDITALKTKQQPKTGTKQKAPVTTNSTGPGVVGLPLGQQLAIRFIASREGSEPKYWSDGLVAEIRQESDLSANDMVDFSRQLSNLCRQFGLNVEMSKSANRMSLLDEVGRRLRSLEENFKHGEDGNSVELLNDIFFQLETGRKFDLKPDKSFADNDVRNPNGEYFGMDLQELYGYCLGLQICTKYTPLEFLDAQCFCDLLAQQCLTGTISEQNYAKDMLTELGAENPIAKSMLVRIYG